ncbi:hypothetical protein LTR94_037168, partial [Friedmanniomyces endolithicus]
HGGAAGRPHRRPGVFLGAGSAADPDAAADARHQAVRLRPGRGVYAAPAVPDPCGAAARDRRPGPQHPGPGLPPDRADRDPGGARGNPSGP